jgi:hypothetical protein
MNAPRSGRRCAASGCQLDSHRAVRPRARAGASRRSSAAACCVRALVVLDLVAQGARGCARRLGTDVRRVAITSSASYSLVSYGTPFAAGRSGAADDSGHDDQGRTLGQRLGTETAGDSEGTLRAAAGLAPVENPNRSARPLSAPHGRQPPRRYTGGERDEAAAPRSFSSLKRADQPRSRARRRRPPDAPRGHLVEWVPRLRFGTGPGRPCRRRALLSRRWIAQPQAAPQFLVSSGVVRTGTRCEQRHEQQRHPRVQSVRLSDPLPQKEPDVHGWRGKRPRRARDGDVRRRALRSRSGM